MRLAAVGGDQVGLRLVVLAALLLAPGDEGDAVTARGAPPRVDNSHSELLELLSSIEKRVTEATACAPSGERLGVPMRSMRQRVSTSRIFFLAMARAGGCRREGGNQRGFASCQSRCARTVGHSAAVML